ncbi:MAG: hypothetical protein K8R36_00940, partial [Planctomycetales bacterium]|nr:hypothetical protein [Planctomycetales bacterium]
FDDENHRAVCHFSDPTYAAQFDTLNHPPILDSLELPDDLSLGGKPAPPPLELPANFNPASSASASSAGSFSVAEPYEDKTNPFRNLVDPRFKK